MIYCFDLDDTLCITNGMDYKNSTPLKERILFVNKLYDEGNKIIIDTARGSVTGINQFKLTENQLNKWGVKYHILRTGIKYHSDYFIDDKGIRDTDFFKQ